MSSASVEGGYGMCIEQAALVRGRHASDGSNLQIRGKITLFVVLACLLTSSGSFIMG